uniref:Uncharacterized protein n=1 Tax=Oryza glaberrima TaxID=4538 RepID=I1R2P4_ORYGL
MVSSGGGGGARHGVVAAWASFFSSRIGLDCQLTEVVSDSVKKPIYLHCQEGNVGASFDSDYILSVASGITNGKPSSNGASTSVEERFTLDKFGQVIVLQCRVLVQMCRSIDNRSAGLKFVSSCTCKGVLYLRRSRGRRKRPTH